MKDIQDPINQRVKILVDTFESGVQRRFALRTGVHTTTINEILGKRQNTPGFDMLHKVLVAYPLLRAEWLMLGEGEMLKPAPGEDAGIKNSVVSAKPKKPIIDPRLLSEDAAQYGDATFSYPTKEADPKQALCNMVEQLNQNTSDIEHLRAAVRHIQEQLKS